MNNQDQHSKMNAYTEELLQDFVLKTIKKMHPESAFNIVLAQLFESNVDKNNNQYYECNCILIHPDDKQEEITVRLTMGPKTD